MLDSLDIRFWLVVAGFIIAFVLAFGIGANDVANSFGTSVGSKVLTLKQACILATIFEILGSILIGAKVSGTIRKGILDPTIFDGHELELMLGYVSALSGCCIWLILATILNLPVSGTHSIVGATIGMAIVSKGIHVIKWAEILKIVLSWFISPLLSGIVSLLMFILIRKFILRAKDPLKAGLRFLPLIYTITIFVNIGGILESSPPLLGFDKIPWWGKLIMITGISVIVYLSIWLILVPFMKKKVQKTIANINANQFDEVEEKEKLNYQANDDSIKKTIATQVDYVTLIVSRNNEDWRLQEKSEPDEIIAINKETLESEQNLSQVVDQLAKIGSHPQASLTIHNDNAPLNIYKGMNKRKRLDSAPTVLKEFPSYDDVNLALGGYLHTIHSPAIRQQLSLRNQNQIIRNRTISSNQSSVTSGGILTKIFQNPMDKSIAHDDSHTIALLNTENDNSTNSNISGKKYGRFTSVPAKIELKNNSQNKIKEPIIEIDAEVEENISELPQKQKKIVVDDFAYSDPPEAAKLFSFLQVLTAIFGSFAHGGNDVSNAIGPLIGLYLIYQDGVILNKSNTPEWILFYGGVGISAGLWILGRRVIKTIGEDLTKITASSGFVIELASAMTVLGASLMNIPVSTTHCKVGSVVFTGRVRSKQSVDWSLFRNIIIAWIVTVPVTGSIAAGCQLVLKIAFGIKL